jgi:hypothetical protein
MLLCHIKTQSYAVCLKKLSISISKDIREDFGRVRQKQCNGVLRQNFDLQ